MKKVFEITDKIVLPPLKYELAHATGESLSFGYAKADPLTIEGEGPLVDLIKVALVNAIHVEKTKNTFVFAISKPNLTSSIAQTIKAYLIEVWCLVNKKTQWRRCSLAKDLAHAGNSTEFLEKMLDLYLDGHKYGITGVSLRAKAVGPIHKLIASQFEKLVEAQCRQ